MSNELNTEATAVSNVRAKFAVSSVNRQIGSEVLTAMPVSSGSDENKSFSKYTPSGKLEMWITNEDLFGWFQPGDEVYLDITKAKKS